MPPPIEQEQESSVADDFSHVATHTLKELRRTTASVLAACHGLERAVEVSDRLKLDRSLAWKIWQVGHGAKSLPSFAHVPGKGGFRQFLEAATRAGVPAGVVADAQQAYAGFEHLTKVYAGDRATAGSMLGVLSDEGRGRLETAVRRDGYRANAYFLGVQAAALYQLDVLHLRPDDRRAVGRMRGHFGLRRNRVNVPWIISRSTLINSRGPSSDVERTALDRDSISPLDNPPSLIVREFSSKPLPALTRRTLGGVTVEDELLPGPVGQMGAADIVTGEYVTWPIDASSSLDAVTMAVATPCERLCYDIIAPAELIPGGLSLRVLSTVQMEHPFLHPTAYCIPVTESFEELGEPHTAAPTPEIPHHAEMIAWALRQSGVTRGPLRLWRLRMKFPPVPSCIAATYAL